MRPTRQGVLWEDGSGDSFLRGPTKQGQLFDFARNADPGQVSHEFAGATFGPGHHTLFVDIRSSTGSSITIRGPWHTGPF